MRYHVRCCRCRARRVASVHPDYTLRRHRCACGSLKWGIDTHRQSGREKKKRKVCRCGGLWFPHRAGSLGCDEYVGGQIDEPFSDYGYDEPFLDHMN